MMREEALREEALREACADAVQLPRVHNSLVRGEGEPFCLYPDQADMLEAISAELDRSSGAFIVAMPTGAGKTVITAELIRRRPAARIIVTAPRHVLIGQLSEKLRRYGITHGFIVGGKAERRDVHVWAATIQAFQRREIPPVDLVIVDECHQGTRGLLEWQVAHPEVRLLGLSATPVKGDGSGLGLPWQKILRGASYPDLVHQGRLVRAQIKAPHIPSLKGARIVGGDIHDETARRLLSGRVLSDIVGHWRRLADGRMTVCFAATVAHAEEIAEAFRRAGVAALAVHSGMANASDARTVATAMLRERRIYVLVSVGMLGLGWDLPELECVAMCRITLSYPEYAQQAGRGARKVPGKTYYLLLDFTGNSLLHGPPHADRTFSLTAEKIPVGQRMTSSGHTTVCRDCLTLYDRTHHPACPACGHMSSRVVKYVDGTLVDYTDEELAIADRIRARAGAIVVARRRLYALRPYSMKLTMVGVEGTLKQFLKDAGRQPDLGLEVWLALNGYKRSGHKR